MTDAPEETLEWLDSEADEIAKSVLNKDPFHGTTSSVAPSLLSATDIVAYVRKTAMVNPFVASRSKLKHASYEACIGKKSYIYEKKNLTKITYTKDNYLCVPANEIVFVELDITFRLPRYIAARFNLQIKHVHRGLLLGTGPLVDPGFRGKLLIPLHNLTSEHYYIHQDDGFIWIEFTRTTFNEDRDEPYGDYPKYKEISDGSKWLHKAAYSEHLRREVPIRSSILPIVHRVERRSLKAIKTVKGVRRTAYAGGLALLVTFALIMLGEIYTNRNFMQAAYKVQAEGTQQASGMVEGVSQDVQDLASQTNQARIDLTQKILDLSFRIQSLEVANAELKQEMERAVQTARTVQ